MGEGRGRGAPAAQRFRALVALAAFDPHAPRWKEAGAAAVGQLLSDNLLYLGAWVQALRPVRSHLIGPLGEFFRGEKLADYKVVAVKVLADYDADDPDALTELLLDADPKQYAVLKPRFRPTARRPWQGCGRPSLRCRRCRTGLGRPPNARGTRGGRPRPVRRSCTSMTRRPFGRCCGTPRTRRSAPNWPGGRGCSESMRRSWCDDWRPKRTCRRGGADRCPG